MSERKGGWLQTYTGASIYPCDPRPEEINIKDIAGSLSKMCRYGGHCLRFYSVAEHSVLMYREAVDRDLSVATQRAMLMHDASEAYLVDIPRPIKYMLTDYKAYEKTLMDVIAKKYGFEYPFSDVVHEFDTRILRDERVQNMKQAKWDNDEWGAPLEGLGVALKYWTPREAEHAFREAFGDAFYG